MKPLLIVLIGFLSACSIETTHRRVYASELKFKAGDVVTHSGFYQNCEGTVVGYSSYVRLEDSNRYSVAFYCQMQWLDNTVGIEEQYLELKNE